VTRLFLGNFDFEYSLSSENSRQPTGPVQRMNEELASVWVAVADDGDFIWTPAAVEEGFFDELASQGLPVLQAVTELRQIDRTIDVCPWGWTDEWRCRADEHNWRFAAPQQSVIREVNSRRFSADLERSWGTGITGAAVIRSIDELPPAIGRIPTGTDRWVVKAEFGMSARERMLHSGRVPDESVLNWVRKHLRADGIVLLEPWVEPVEEAGLQYTVPWSGMPVFEGVVPLLCDSSGVYRGSQFSLDVEAELRWMPAIETGMRVARLLKQRGYFGPLGIDAMRYRDTEGAERIRPLQDINARHTMGRLALGLRRLLKPGQYASWLYARPPADSPDAPRRWFQKISRQLPAGVRLVRTSPFLVGNEPVRHFTVVVMAPSAELRDEVEAKLLNVDRSPI